MWRYQLLIRLIAPLLLIWLAWEAIKRQGSWRFILQRLGFDYRFTSRPAQPIWIHCASVGEVRLITPLIQAEPEQAWLITCNTPTGMRAAQSVSHPRLQLAYLPLDYPSAIQRFLALAQPQALWVVETELWPNLYQTAKKAGLTIHLINGRLSAKSLRAPAWLKQAYQACFTACDSIMVRHPTDKQDFISLGAAANKIQVVGNLKLSNLQQPRHQPAPTSADYVVMASTHQGEDIALIEHWLALGRTELLVVAPRHPHHARRLFKTLQQRGVMVCLADTLPATPPPGLVCIEQRFGQLLAWFEHAKIVVMGGSFVTKGGHNFLEAAAYGRCILTGPDNRDFAPEAALFEQEGGLIICPNYEKLQQRLNQLLTNAALRERYGTRAAQLIAQQPDVLTAYRLALGRID
ncbi:3-deoxy-D-manno-octulosonic acid transferase [Thiomicrospira sp. ALE5]|uniref:3-deoxy-D-manno-octulosonic acid transferase n=1 Tax=Thiomicrospira sp. ALE5 TaxID=748650 RepID=UPI0008F2D195|nr:glycosyltransferase N-terminal domain-containing protein [Thiomicrospira sp. ALE5]SFR64112.1 3-deoxy-D-manno-octulosonic-acid transferase [Thiomicrospira sp. ALE5]